jgi:hypothetical protein
MTTEIRQTASQTFRIHLGYDDYKKVSHALVTAILWRVFPTRAAAEQFAKDGGLI